MIIFSYESTLNTLRDSEKIPLNESEKSWFWADFSYAKPYYDSNTSNWQQKSGCFQLNISYIIFCEFRLPDILERLWLNIDQTQKCQINKIA